MSGLRLGCCVWGWILVFAVLSLPGPVEGQPGSTEPEGRGPGGPRDGMLYVMDPLADDIFRASDAVEIIGTVQGPDFQYYHAEWGYGQNPTEWFSAGISLSNGGFSPVVDDTLGWWETPSLAQPEMTTLRVTAVFTSNDRVRLLHIQLDPAFKPGWPVKIYSNSSRQDVGLVETLVLDLNNDHNKEIVVYIAGTPPMLHVFDHTGAPLPNYPIVVAPADGGDDIRVPAPVAGDMNNDGLDEIVLFRPMNGEGNCTNPPHVMIYNYDGQQLAAFPVVYPGFGHGYCRYFCSGRQGLSLADLDRNGTLEIIIVGEGAVTVLDNQGNTLSGWPKLTPGWIGGPHEGSPSVANLDADDDLEIVVAKDYADPYPPGPNTGRVYAWNLDGSDVPGWPIDTVGFSFGSPSIGDLDNDGEEEIVVGFKYINVPTEHGICVYDKSGNVRPGWPQLQGRHVWSNPILADFDGDNELEIVVSSHTSTGNTTVLRHDGSTVPGWPQSTCEADWYSPIVADITGDGVPDVITNNKDLDGICSVYAWDAQGGLIAGFPKFTGGIAEAPTVVADLDNDGDLELIASTYGRVTGSTWVRRADIYIWELDAPLDPSSMHWPMFRRDINHTGRYVRPPDCNENWTPDDEDIASGASEDCNNNGVPDECDIAAGDSPDLNGNGIPDECEVLHGDLNCDDVVDLLDVAPFAQALVDPAGYAVAYPDCDILRGDTSGDDVVNGNDLQPFVDLLMP